MRICLLGYGSRGDVQPMVALGRVLQQAGHEVAVAAPRDFSDSISRAGLACEPFDIDLDRAGQSELGRRWLDGSSVGLRREGQLMGEVVRVFAPVVTDTVVRVADRYQAFVSGLLTLDPMLSIAASRGVAHATASLAPSRPTRVGGASLYPVRPQAVSVLNLVSGYLTGWGGHRVLRAPGDQARGRLGLPRQGFRRYVQRARRTPALLAASPRVVPASGDPRTVVTGYWVTPPDPGYAPPAELTAFLDAADPPVYLGFGSMPSRDPAALYATMVDALRGARLRGVVHGSWGGWRPDAIPDEVFLLDGAPHAWLFPRMAAVVHHGGAGTTGSAVRAGVPQLAVPHMGDQPYWGRRIGELGIGPAPIRRHLLDAEKLAAALTTMSTDGAMADRARALAATVRDEDGVARAVEALARLWRLRRSA